MELVPLDAAPLYAVRRLDERHWEIVAPTADPLRPPVIGIEIKAIGSGQTMNVVHLETRRRKPWRT